jgi:FkbM family methyltransferase
MNTKTIVRHRTIYDVGANNGDDIPYYLIKADRVVAIEANPELCKTIQRRFQKEIDAGILIVENCVVTENEENRDVSFYIHNVKHVLSQLPKPEKDAIHNFSQVTLPSKSIASIIQKYGLPYYIKIDLENYDNYILSALFKNGIRPPYISVECHGVDTFANLVANGNYDSLKLVDGASVSCLYANALIAKRDSTELIRYSFPRHSAGPFGNDVLGDWLDASKFLKLIAMEGFGWKDIHASNCDSPNPKAKVPFWKYFIRFAFKPKKWII